MSSQIVKREITDMIGCLLEQGRHIDAALLDMAVFDAKDNLSILVRIRDNWDDIVFLDKQ